MTTSKPHRMDGYIRVSRVAGREGESFISPDVQREQIEAWAKLRGVEVADWHKDLDKSGGKLRRPGLDTLLERIEAGDTCGVIVAKLDRLSRLGVADALKLVERITGAGGTIAAIDLGIDPTTPFGEFGMTIMLALARMERRRISDSWAVAQTRALERGAVISPTPFGYTREPDGTLSAHPDQGPIVTEAYRLAAQDGPQAASTYLERVAPHREWNTARARRSLGRRVYLGESQHAETVKRDAHPALTDRATWEAAQSTPRGRRTSVAYPLSLIATCAECGEPMTGSQRGTGQRSYRCASRSRKDVLCPAPVTVSADALETYVRDALRESRSAHGWDIGGETSEGMAAVEDTLAEAEAELEAFAADQTLRRTLGTRYHSHLEARADAVAEAQAAYRAEASKQARQTRVLSVELFDTEDPTELRELFSAALGAVVVTKGRGPIAERVRLVGYGDDDLTGVTAPQDAALSGS
jgi:DNA invertase Pin-like site-specific DNA recombinase/ribosomal protein L34E